ncbi:MAG TPA: proton-conducting transporter membrane subunit, partial [Puia sp.]|nr:proton-conducting transporter membrane subunit [Puia sp.]
NIGLIGMGIGIGLIGKASGNTAIFYIGFLAALLHTLNHSLYKSLLFFTAGNIYRQTHTRDMDRLGGLIRRMPQTALLFLSGSLAICALPPFNGFISEFLIYTGFTEGIKTAGVQLNLLMIAGIAALAIAGGLSLFTFTKSFGVIFLGSPRTAAAERPEEVPLPMRLPLYVILLIMLLIGFFPNTLIGVLLPVADVFDGGIRAGNYSPNALLGWAGPLFGVLVGVVFVIYRVRTALVRKMPAPVLSTWGCGYIAPDSRMQYTGKSFSKSLAKLFSFFTTESKKYAEIMGIFPEGRSYQSHYIDFFESRIFHWLRNRLLAAINSFGFIQTGQTQQYVLYGLFFMVILIIASFLNYL